MASTFQIRTDARTTEIDVRRAQDISHVVPHIADLARMVADLSTLMSDLETKMRRIESELVRLRH